MVLQIKLLVVVVGGGCAARFSKSRPYFRPIFSQHHFPNLFSDLALKFHTRLRTRLQKKLHSYHRQPNN